MSLLSALLLLLSFSLIAGNTYHGSNNPLRKRTQNRLIAKRQNDNDGGYNIGERYNQPAANDVNKHYPMQYFMSDPGSSQGVSELSIEWTNQHGCGDNDPNNSVDLHCNKILQFMCRPVSGNNAVAVTDGTSTSTNTATNGDSQETLEWYDKCSERTRNKNLKRDESTHTLQNSRNGYECPEERDYFPYWNPSDWKDIAILTQNPERCSSYKSESFNVKPKHECREKFLGSTEDLPFSPAKNKEQCDQRGGTWTLLHSYLEKLPLGEDDCEARSYPKASKLVTTWGYAIDGKGKKECLVKLSEPDCKAASATSEDGKGGKYMWKLPHFPSGQTQKCVYRIKYNTTIEDYDPYNTNSKSNNDEKVRKNDPKVNLGIDGGQKLQLALDTAHKLQERSRVFLIEPRDTTFGHKNIHGVDSVDVKKEVFSLWNKIRAKLQQLTA